MSLKGECCLDIDAGNTNLKWRLSLGGQVLASGRSDTTFSVIDEEIERLGCGLSRCRLASVAGDALVARVQAWVHGRYSVRVEEAKVGAEACGLVNSYKNPENMGVDRWLAAVAAFDQCKSACLVVDCGSAVTVELISGDGHHRGGYIVPGLGLMRRSLFQDTDAVKVVATPLATTLSAGKNTADAVNHGLVLMVVGLIEKALAELVAEASSPSPILWVTGGDGKMLMPHLPASSRFDEQLVLDGLARLIP